MTQYHNFIGIDIGKFSFFVSVYGQQDVREFDNDSKGISSFLKAYKNKLSSALCLLESTGNCELELLYTLCCKGYSVHRADTRKIKNFIRSYGGVAKSDRLDAKAIAKYGFERKDSLKLFTPQSKESLELFSLVQRRFDLVQMSIAEKNRLKAPGNKFAKSSCERMIALLKKEIDSITVAIMKVIDSDKLLKQKQNILMTIPGVGLITSFQMLVLLPELGSLDRRKIAALAGLAPISNDSGQYSGYRRCGYGRSNVKPVLFLCAMAARRSKSELKAFYESLIGRGKKKMVALVALMRKILIIANARLRDAMKDKPADEVAI